TSRWSSAWGVILSLRTPIQWKPSRLARPVLVQGGRGRETAQLRRVFVACRSQRLHHTRATRPGGPGETSTTTIALTRSIERRSRPARSTSGPQGRARLMSGAPHRRALRLPLLDSSGTSRREPFDAVARIGL